MLKNLKKMTFTVTVKCYLGFLLGLIKYHSQRQRAEEMVYFFVQLSVHIPLLKGSTAGSYTKTVEECYLLPCYSWLAHLPF